jgi:hypothetical protein
MREYNPSNKISN